MNLFHSKESSNSEFAPSPPISKKDIVLLDFQAPNETLGGSRLLHVKADTKIEKVIKQFCGLLGKNSPEDFSLIIPSSSKSDDIYLLPEYSLWMYDLVGVVIFHSVLFSYV